MTPPRWPWSPRPQVQGVPPSANGASSFHLFWHLEATEPLVEVAAVLEVVRPPTVDRLYFWALQVSFLDGEADRGAAHVGLQWNRNHPGGRAVNWGGYATGGGLLAGSPSGLPSAPNDPNTRNYPWEPGQPYRLRVSAAPGRPGHWRGEVTDLIAGRAAVIRDLDAGGDRLAHVVVWSEVFARCDDPQVSVRWSDLQATTIGGQRLRPAQLSVGYQAAQAGGCDNTTVIAEPLGVLQVTNAKRLVAPGSSIALRQ